MFETVIPSTLSPYQLHQHLEKRFRHALGDQRYQFCIVSPEHAWVRSPIDVDGFDWKPVDFPKAGQTVEFTARLIPQIVGKTFSPVTKKRERHRRYLFDDESRQYWIRDKLGEKGFDVIEADFTNYMAKIDKPGKSFIKHGVIVRGSAEITQDDLAFELLKNGIGESKPFGFGSIIITEIKQ